MPTEGNRESKFTDIGRLVALIDGVFAVAMTLLVLDVKIPSESKHHLSPTGRSDHHHVIDEKPYAFPLI